MPRIAAGGEPNRHGLLCWPTEAGLHRRIAYGANDEVGWKVVIDLVT